MAKQVSGEYLDGPGLAGSGEDSKPGTPVCYELPDTQFTPTPPSFLFLPTTGEGMMGNMEGILNVSLCFPLLSKINMGDYLMKHLEKVRNQEVDQAVG